MYKDVYSIVSLEVAYTNITRRIAPPQVCVLLAQSVKQRHSNDDIRDGRRN